MEDKIKAFLASGKLEEYIYGSLDQKGEVEVEHYIQNYPDVKREYEVLQDQLEELSMKAARKAPLGMKSQILDSLPDKTVATEVTSSTPSWIKYLAFTGVAASLLFAFGWFNANQKWKSEQENFAKVMSDCEEREKQIERQQQQIAFLNSEQTYRYDLEGNTLAPDYKAMVFVNESIGKAIFSTLNEAQLPENKCLQLWGDLEGEMIPIAVLSDKESGQYDLNINPEFTSLNLTIEEVTEDGKGQDHPDVSQLIASVTI